MAEVKILIEGYLGSQNECRSCSTVTLVVDGKLRIVVDPGTVRDPSIIEKRLREEGLSTGDINVVFITHSHMDHYRNIGMFRNAKALDYFGWWEGDMSRECDGSVSENIMLVQTPGHSRDSVSLIVKTKQGRVAICGDVFWKKNFPRKDPYATDRKRLNQSRKRILKMADWVVPGHAGMFRA